MWAFALLLFGAPPKAISLDVSADVGCDLEVEVRAAIHKNLPGLAIGDGGLRLELTGRSSTVAMTLREAEQVSLSRSFDAHEGCVAVADAVAIVLERHLSDLGWTPSAVDLPAEPTVWPKGLALEAAGLAGASGFEGAAFGASIGARFDWGPLRAGLDGSYVAPTDRAVLRGGAEIGRAGGSVFGVFLGAGACLDAGLSRSCLTFGPGIELWSMTTTGDIFQKTEQAPILPALALRLEEDLDFGGFGLHLELRGGWRGGAGLSIEDADVEDVSPARLSIGAAIGVSYHLFDG